MPAPARFAAVHRPLPSVGRVAAWLACAVLAVGAWLAGWTLTGALAGTALGALTGLWLGRRSMALAAGRLLSPRPLPDQEASDPPRTDLHLADRAPGGPPELRPLAEAIRALLARQQALFDAQAEQLEALRRQAHGDPLTGLANRRHFVAMLDAVLDGGALPAESGLLLLRLQDLQGLNQRIGHAAADRALLAVAEALQAYPDRIGRCFAGRLNGSDFALLLPVAGMVHETAAALSQALRMPLAAIDAQARVFAGAVELDQPLSATQALALADAALAWAEGDHRLPESALTHALPPADTDLPQGELTWQRRISHALAQGQVALEAFPVCTGDGRQLHLDCPLRLQLRRDGPMEPASRWLSLALRSRLCAAVDERAVALALAAIADDGQARCVNMAAQSLASAEFVAAVSRRLERAPDAACRLWIDLPETLALERPMLVREVSRRWRPLGVMLGLEHAGEGLARIPELIDLGLDCVRIDSRFVNGITAAGAADARRHLQGLVKLVQAVGLQVSAEGVRSAADLEALWQLGFDAATGPAVLAQTAADTMVA